MMDSMNSKIFFPAHKEHLTDLTGSLELMNCNNKVVI